MLFEINKTTQFHVNYLFDLKHPQNKIRTTLPFLRINYRIKC